MTFKLEKTQQAVFDCVDGMMTYFEQEKKNTSCITIGGLKWTPLSRQIFTEFKLGPCTYYN